VGESPPMTLLLLLYIYIYIYILLLSGICVTWKAKNSSIASLKRKLIDDVKRALNYQDKYIITPPHVAQQKRERNKKLYYR
jgi:hypothetical protein